MGLLELDPDQLLSTTRAVRKRLDLDRPVPPELIKECVAIAQQAPTGSNRQTWSFVVVTDPTKKAALGEIYKRAFDIYRDMPRPQYDDTARAATQERVVSSAQYLADVMGQAPVLLVPCIEGRADNVPNVVASSLLGSIIPAAWSFCLAARARGLGTSWTTLHLMFEKEAADALGIPFDSVSQVALIPVAYTKGVDFKTAHREPVESVLHYDGW
ncbi:MAG TPA: nitroreductase family protein [Acidimicrobiales bacterium]|nr:nitroreductase family protein [Acidimicrobiales bacterium]